MCVYQCYMLPPLTYAFAIKTEKLKVKGIRFFLIKNQHDILRKNKVLCGRSGLRLLKQLNLYLRDKPLHPYTFAISVFYYFSKWEIYLHHQLRRDSISENANTLEIHRVLTKDAYQELFFEKYRELGRQSRVRDSQMDKRKEIHTRC